MLEMFGEQTAEPDGPQDAIPPGYAAEVARLAHLSTVRRARTRTLTTTTILIIDLVLAIAGYLAEWSIGDQTTLGTSAGGFARHQGIETLVVGGAVCLALLVCAFIAGRTGAVGACVLQCGMVLCLIAGTGLVAADFFGQGDGELHRPVPATDSTGIADARPAPAAMWYCSGGTCYGWATKEG